MFACLLVVAITAMASFGMGFVSRWLATRAGAIDVPTPGIKKKIHRSPTPLWGGLGIFVVGAVGVGVLAWMGKLAPALSTSQLVGFGLGALILLVVGLIDDRYPLPPKALFPLYLLACICVVVGGTSIGLITNPTGGIFSLVFTRWNAFGGALSFAFPSDLITIGWLMAILFATKLMDGMDGLVSGQASIGGAIILLLCILPAYHLPAVALLSAILLGAYLGFLPKNLFPAKQFLGESGSTLAGFTLGFLSIASGAKLATALMALGVALIDIGLVVLGRLRRHVPITQGDRTHLHHQLLDAGFTQRQAVVIIWSIGLFFGLAALFFQTRGKLVLLGVLVIVTIGLSIYATHRSHNR